MSEEILVFDSFVDDLLDSDNQLLKFELDYLLMQHIFNSLDLKELSTLNEFSDDNLLAA